VAYKSYNLTVVATKTLAQTLAWHGIKYHLQGRSGIRTANDGSVRSLTFVHQLATGSMFGPGTEWPSIHEAPIALLSGDRK
jgi:hypothetical protein